MFLLFERIPHKKSSIFFLFRSFERSELQAHFQIYYYFEFDIIAKIVINELLPLLQWIRVPMEGLSDEYLERVRHRVQVKSAQAWGRERCLANAVLG